MATPDQIDTLVARHATHVHRYSTYTLNRVIALLERVDTRITGKLESQLAGLTLSEQKALLAGKYTTQRLLAIRENIRALSHDTRQALSSVVGDAGKQLAGYEVGYAQNMIAAVTENAVGATVTGAQAYAAAMSRPMQGKHVRALIADIEPDTRRRLEAEIREAFVSGEGSTGLARRIRGTVAMNNNDSFFARRNKRLETLIRTVNSHISTVADQEAYKAHGVKRVVWRSTLDGRTSKICAARDGNVYKIGSGPRPPAHLNCRSDIIPYVKNMDWDRPSVADKRPVSKIPKSERADVIKKVPATKDYKKWFDEQDAAYKKEWLGPARYKLYKKGVGLDKFADPRTGRQYNLTELAAHDKKAFEAAGLKVAK